VSASALLGLLLISHHLELVHLLQLGDLEGAVGLAGLHLEVVDLHVPLLDGVLHVELLAEDGAALVVQLLHKGGQVVLAHPRDVGELSHLLLDRVWHDHDDFLGFEEVGGEEW